MSAAKEKPEIYSEKIVELRIAGHPVRLSFAAEPNPTAAQRVRNCLVDSFLCQDRAKRGAA